MSQEGRIIFAVEKLEEKLGTTITYDMYTRAHVYDYQPSRPYEVCLIGPLFDSMNPDVRLWITDRKLGGTRALTLRVQDKDDDVILNVDAQGIENYDIGPIHLEADILR